MTHDELISAALDGERVDLVDLRAALAEPDGREALASFVLLRAAVASDEDAPGPAFYEAMAPVLRPRAGGWLLAGPRIPAAIAASVLIVLAAGSFWLGRGTGGARPNGPKVVMTAAGHGEMPAVTAMQEPPALPPPVPSAPRVVGGIVEGPAPERAASAATLSATDRDPPMPSRVLRFVPGVDWRNGSSD
jgi:hypothetical protein